MSASTPRRRSVPLLVVALLALTAGAASGRSQAAPSPLPEEARADIATVAFAPQGQSWLEAQGGIAQIQLLVDANNLPNEAVQLGAYRQAAGSISIVHTHEHIEIFYITAGELVNITRAPGTDEPVFHIAKAGMVSVVPREHNVIHWVPSETEPAVGLVLWVGREAEHLEDVGLDYGTWRAPFDVDSRIPYSDLPEVLRQRLQELRDAHGGH